MPSRHLTSLAQQFWKALTTSRCSSGSKRVASALEPTMSQNITVSWRRSGADADWAGRQAADTGFRAVPVLVARLVPHWGQNLAPGGLVFPQPGHMAGSADPHSAQKLAAVAIGALQLGHSTSPPTLMASQVITVALCEER